jgi:hypothetical protein
VFHADPMPPGDYRHWVLLSKAMEKVTSLGRQEVDSITCSSSCPSFPSRSARIWAGSTTDSDAPDATERSTLTPITGNADMSSSTVTRGVDVTVELCGCSLEVDTSGQNVVLPQGGITTGGECTNVVPTGSGGAGVDNSSRGDREKERDDGELHYDEWYEGTDRDKRFG